VDVLRPVVRRIEATEHLVLLAQGLLIGGHVVVEDRFGRGQGTETEAQHGGVQFGGADGPGLVGGFAEIEVVFAVAVPGLDAQARQAIATLLDHQVVLKQLESLDQHIGAVGHEVLPAVLAGPVVAAAG